MSRYEVIIYLSEADEAYIAEVSLNYRAAWPMVLRIKKR